METKPVMPAPARLKGGHGERTATVASPGLPPSSLCCHQHTVQAPTGLEKTRTIAQKFGFP